MFVYSDIALFPGPQRLMCLGQGGQGGRGARHVKLHQGIKYCTTVKQKQPRSSPVLHPDKGAKSVLQMYGDHWAGGHRVKTPCLLTASDPEPTSTNTKARKESWGEWEGGGGRCMSCWVKLAKSVLCQFVRIPLLPYPPLSFQPSSTHHALHFWPCWLIGALLCLYNDQQRDLWSNEVVLPWKKNGKKPSE